MTWKSAVAHALITDSARGIAERTLLEMLEVAQDKRHGAARRMLVEEMYRFKDPRMVDVLIGLLGDPEIRGREGLSLRLRKPGEAG
ncbi:MAG TPA: hypothetical protein GX510_03470 [Firmicutes bacterium]|nr:hypothetical protein [Candidatus Fermentithermobacillaceae bacterium]